MNPVAMIRGVDDHGDRYDAIMLWCPGCEHIDPVDGRRVGGLHMLPINGDSTKRPTWDWNGVVDAVTLSPSILTHHGGDRANFVCHSFLRNGHWQFLGDCTHALANKTVPMVPLPDWVVR